MDPATPAGAGTSVSTLHADCLSAFDKSIICLHSSNAFHSGRVRTKKEQATAQLESSKFKLKQWKDTWNLQHDLSQKDVEFSIWGEAGWKDIYDMLNTILVAVEALLRTMSYKDLSKAKRTFRRLAQTVQIKQRNSDWDQVLQNLQSISERTDILWRISELQFHAQHASITSNLLRSSTSSQPDKPSRKSLEHMTMATRLYEAFAKFYSHIGVPIHDIRSVNEGLHLVYWPNSDLNIKYELKVSFLEGQKQLSFNEPNNYVDETDLLATIKLLQKHESKILRLQHRIPGEYFYYRLEDPHQELPPANCSRALSDFIMPSMASERLSLGERFELASGLADTMSTCLSTPWLSHMTSNTLERRQGPETVTVYVHRVQKSSPVPTTEASSLARHNIMRLGTLLAEIGLRRRLSNDNVRSRKQQAEILAQLTASMGADYMRACAACLQLSEPPEFLTIDASTYASRSQCGAKDLIDDAGRLQVHLPADLDTMALISGFHSRVSEPLRQIRSRL